MDAVTEWEMPEPPLGVLVPCSEACACCKRFGHDGWNDYALCTNPRSSFRGYPVRLGRDCRNFATTVPPAATATDPADAVG